MQSQPDSQNLPESAQGLFLLSLIVIVGCCVFFTANQHNLDTATLAHLRDAGSIKVVIYDPHHEHHRKPSAECPDRRFIGFIPRIKGIKAILMVSQIAQSQGSDTVVREQSKPWQWKQETEMRNGHVVIQPIGILIFAPGTYRARLTVEKNGEKIIISSKDLLSIPAPTTSVKTTWSKEQVTNQF